MMLLGSNIFAPNMSVRFGSSTGGGGGGGGGWTPADFGALPASDTFDGTDYNTSTIDDENWAVRWNVASGTSDITVTSDSVKWTRATGETGRTLSDNIGAVTSGTYTWYDIQVDNDPDNVYFMWRLTINGTDRTWRVGSAYATPLRINLETNDKAGYTSTVDLRAEWNSGTAKWDLKYRADGGSWVTGASYSGAITNLNTTCGLIVAAPSTGDQNCSCGRFEALDSSGNPVNLRSAGVTAFWDATDASSITESSGVVSQWDDQSGTYSLTAAGALQPTTGTQTINGNNAIYFDGTERMDGDSLASVFTGNHKRASFAAVLASQNGGDNPGFICSFGNSAGGPQYWGLKSTGTTSKTFALAKDDTSNNYSHDASSDVAAGEHALVTAMDLGSSQVSTHLNGAAQTRSEYTDVDSTMDKFSVGAQIAGGIDQGYEDMYLGMLMIFDGPLTMSDREKVEGYLAWTWGMQYHLASGHTYEADGTEFGFSTAWLPSDVSPISWWNGADYTQLAKSANLISAVTDQGSNTKNMLQGGGSDQPSAAAENLNGAPTISFVSRDWMQTAAYTWPTSGDYLIALVYERTANSDDSSCVISYDSSGADWQLQAGAAAQFDPDLALNGMGSSGIATFNNNPHDGPSVMVLAFDFTGGTVKGYVDGTEQLSMDYSTKAANGGNFNWMTNRAESEEVNGRSPEMVIIGDDVTTATRQKLEGYLAWKNGLNFQLDSSNPYRYDGSLFGYDSLWTPADITTSAWYDASDTSTITESGGLVSQFDDKSGNDHHLVQAIGSKQPETGVRTLNGLNALDHASAGDDHMACSSFPLPSSGDVAFFMVASMDAWTTSGAAIFSVDAATNDFELNSSSSTEYKAKITETGLGTDIASSNANNGPAIYNTNFDYNGIGRYNIYVDGVEEVGRTYVGNKIGTTQTLYAFADRGGNTTADGLLAEFVICEDVTEATRQKIEGYLAHKYGIEASLPSGHPYKSAPPTT